jgi:hypothetical protein
MEEEKIARWREMNLPFYMDKVLIENLTYIKNDVLKHDYDGFIVVDGKEGDGKSVLAGQIARFFDPTYNIERCAFNEKQFMNASKNAGEFKAVVFDETMGYLSSRGAMSEFNRTLIKVFSEMRSKHLFVVICIPSFFELDKYPAIHRSIGLIHITKRGSYSVYNYEKKKLLYVYGKKFYEYKISPNFHGTFSKYFPLDKYEYEIKKREATMGREEKSDEKQRLKDQKIVEKKEYKEAKEHRKIILEFLYNELGMTYDDMAELLKTKKSTIRYWLGKIINQ